MPFSAFAVFFHVNNVSRLAVKLLSLHEEMLYDSTQLSSSLQNISMIFQYRNVFAWNANMDDAISLKKDFLSLFYCFVLGFVEDRKEKLY